MIRNVFTGEKRDREEIRKLLQMTDCRSSKDTSDEAVKVRDALCEKLWVEKVLNKGHYCTERLLHGYSYKLSLLMFYA